MSPSSLPLFTPHAVQLVAQVGAAPEGGGRPAGGGAGAPGPGGALGSMLLPLVMFVAIYFLMIRPANKRQQEQEADRDRMLKALRKDDQVVTKGGMVGKITGLSDTEVTLEISERVRVKFLRSAIESKYPPPSANATSSGTETATAKS